MSKQHVVWIIAVGTLNWGTLVLNHERAKRNSICISKLLPLPKLVFLQICLSLPCFWGKRTPQLKHKLFSTNSKFLTVFCRCDFYLHLTEKIACKLNDVTKTNTETISSPIKTRIHYTLLGIRQCQIYFFHKCFSSSLLHINIYFILHTEVLYSTSLIALLCQFNYTLESERMPIDSFNTATK